MEIIFNNQIHLLNLMLVLFLFFFKKKDNLRLKKSTYSCLVFSLTSAYAGMWRMPHWCLIKFHSHVMVGF